MRCLQVIRRVVPTMALWTPFSRSLIPGVGTYDLFKRLGYSKTYDEAADRRRMEKDALERAVKASLDKRANKE